ncbi:uncharacterized protein LOC106177972 [Lingula anatina]|uniref:Uncharacterized protein LOC106177972 n=1 Tax=Lingula anatina TaxID=7574 RepID=A0A1S3K181_LINAN|nr:uncharacterized protein LOC106177972 [Lingula anatina]|eukprot:XP_013416385.1 uncharacterized protein LOC106177972 [Lingula anatina]
MERCCCCCNLRQGSWASSILTLVIGILSLAWYIYEAVAVSERDRQGAGSYFGVNTGGGWAFYLGIIFAAFIVVASVLLMIGISKNNRVWFWPWFVATLALCVFELIAIIFYIIVAIDAPGYWLSVVIGLLILALFIYALVGVIYFYKQLGNTMRS